MAPASTIPRGEADAIVGRIEEARGWSTHASNGWSICSVGGPFRNDAPAWICVMCEPEHLAPGETIETQIERFAAWLAGLGYALTRESMMHPACFSLAPGPVAVEGPALAEARATIARLNRRAQQAEAIADRCIPGRPMTGPGLGRALANYSAARLTAIAEAALDGWDRAVSLRPDTPDEREWLTWALAVLTGRENGEGRATVAGMASPHSPPPTKSLPSLLAEIETAAQEAMRLHPHALHLRSVLALCDVTRRENACEEPDPSPTPTR